METSNIQLQKENKGLKLIWNKLKDIFAIKSTAAETTPTVTTPTFIPAASVAPKREEAAVLPKQEQPIESLPGLEVDKAPQGPAQHIEPTSRPPQDPSHTQEGSQQETEMRPNKVQAIFARYNLELDETEWDQRPKVPYERVHKNIRMRIKYTCHNCSTTFGRDRVCVGCQHRRCTRCSRYPPKKERTKAPQDATDTTPPQPATDAPRPNAEGGTCHECQTGFEVDVEQCPNCQHQICERCLHEATITVESSQDPSSQSAQEAAVENDPEQRTTAQAESTAVS